MLFHHWLADVSVFSYQTKDFFVELFFRHKFSLSLPFLESICFKSILPATKNPCNNGSAHVSVFVHDLTSYFSISVK